MNTNDIVNIFANALPGFFPLYWDEATGKLYWEIDKLDTEFLYQVSMASGLGSNPVGIDRGQLSGTYVLVARRTGPRVLLEQPNYKYQARVDNPDQKEAVRDAFAPSVHWGFDVVAQTGKSVLVDASPFFLRDARGVIETLARTNQGRYQVDGSRSVLYPARIKSFPENAEVEAMLTFTSAQPGPLVNGVAASGEAVTLRIHHSLVKMPDAGYSPRFRKRPSRRVAPCGRARDGAEAFATILFSGCVAHWIANTLASVLRGTGDMKTPGYALVATAAIQIPLCGALTLGWFGLPKFGIRGPAIAAVIVFALAAVWMLSRLVGPNAALRLRWPRDGFRWRSFNDILKVGLIACLVVILTNGTVLMVTGLVGRAGDAAIAGYGIGSRLEYMLVPISFGIGAALTALVGTNIGARQYARARKLAWSGAPVVYRGKFFSVDVGPVGQEASIGLSVSSAASLASATLSVGFP